MIGIDHVRQTEPVNLQDGIPQNCRLARLHKKRDKTLLLKKKQ